MGCSVIIPVYNVKAYLDRCLQSVVAQSYPDVEIILIDDGSTDGSDVLCARWADRDKRIRFTSQANKGLGPTRNRGMQMSTHDYVTFIDADDWVDTDFIAKHMAALAASHADMSVSDINYVDSVTGKSTVAELRLKEAVVSAAKDHSVVNKIRLFAWGKVYRKAMLLENNIVFPHLSFEDTAFTPLAAIKSKSICYVKGTMYNYLRARSDGLASNADGIVDVDRALHLLKHEMLIHKATEYDLEFKKIALGQLRFVVRKWDNAEDIETQARLSDIYRSLGIFYPHLANLRTKKYFANGDALLKKALDLALPSASNIVECAADADFVVTMPQEFVPESSLTISAYNLAELIMEKL